LFYHLCGPILCCNICKEKRLAGSWLMNTSKKPMVSAVLEFERRPGFQRGE
jgi:hypothetical protein